MTSGEIGTMMLLIFAILIVVRVPVAFALGIACVPVFFLDDRLSPVLLLTEMHKSYNSFVLLAVPFFILAANLMNSSGWWTCPAPWSGTSGADWVTSAWWSA
jgi:TRAP-type mannitol/chloroaromatic compound transport system permease large subunit